LSAEQLVDRASLEVPRSQRPVGAGVAGTAGEDGFIRLSGSRAEEEKELQELLATEDAEEETSPNRSIEYEELKEELRRVKEENKRWQAVVGRMSVLLQQQQTDEDEDEEAGEEQENSRDSEQEESPPVARRADSEECEAMETASKKLKTSRDHKSRRSKSGK
jgi:hypothetical protein